MTWPRQIEQINGKDHKSTEPKEAPKKKDIQQQAVSMKCKPQMAAIKSIL